MKTKITLGVPGVTRHLCRLAAKLGVPVVTVRRWPKSGPLRNAHGAYIFYSGRDTRAILRRLHIEPPVILLRYCAPYVLNPGGCPARTAMAGAMEHVLAHEIGHHFTKNSDVYDACLRRTKVSRLLKRLAARHGINRYCRASRSELRAECIGLRLLGETLSSTLRRLTARAWAELEWRTSR